MKMKKYIKPMILIVLSIIFVIVISIPANLTAIQYYPGMTLIITGKWTCICPIIGTCQCGFLEPKE